MDRLVETVVAPVPKPKGACGFFCGNPGAREDCESRRRDRAPDNQLQAAAVLFRTADARANLEDFRSSDAFG
jgi:hypothetical protein